MGKKGVYSVIKAISVYERTVNKNPDMSTGRSL